MNELIERLGVCIERGKVNAASPYPRDMKGMDGADELTEKALASSVGPDELLRACTEGMQRIGIRFGRNEVFVPELLMAAKAMQAVMSRLKPFFEAGTVRTKGSLVLGTVAGDIHDIGKNLVAMVVAGNGWEVIDLGVDVKPQKFIDSVGLHAGCIVGLSALLTSTMVNMERTVHEIKSRYPATRVVVGGAPLDAEIAATMGADGYAPDPQQAVTVLEGFVAASREE